MSNNPFITPFDSLPNSEVENAVYLMGCAGRITQFRKASDCLIEMVLTGVCRFDIG